MIYLASPYTHEDPEEEEARFRRVCIGAARLINMGYQVYSPIAMTHPIHKFSKGHHVHHIARLHNKRPSFWYQFDEAMMSRCSHLVILGITGWKESKGVAIEYKYFVERELNWTIFPWMQVISKEAVSLQWYRGDLIEEKAEQIGV